MVFFLNSFKGERQNLKIVSPYNLPREICAKKGEFANIEAGVLCKKRGDFESALCLLLTQALAHPLLSSRPFSWTQ